MRPAGLLPLVALIALGGTAQAEEAVPVGVVFPLTGPTAARGAVARPAIELGAEIINTPHGLERLPLGAGQGLPHLNGAKIVPVFADDLGNPSVAQSQVMRLVRHDKAAALIGGGDAAAAAERLGVPLVVPDPAAPEIVERGFGWVFRSVPGNADGARAYAQFLSELKTSGGNFATVVIVHDAGEHAAAAARLLREAIGAAGFEVTADIAYPAGAAELSAPVAQLRDKHPDVAILVSNAVDAALLIKTMKALDYRPPLLIGDGAGFAEPGFVAAAGNLAQGLIDRSAWRVGPPGSAGAILAGLYRSKTGRDLDDVGAQILQGFLVLAAAIDRAGMTDPAAIRQALRDSDLKPEELVVGYRGVRFDMAGQNTLAAFDLIQLQGKAYATIWPAGAATATPMLPYRGWK